MMTMKPLLPEMTGDPPASHILELVNRPVQGPVQVPPLLGREHGPAAPGLAREDLLETRVHGDRPLPPTLRSPLMLNAVLVRPLLDADVDETVFEVDVLPPEVNVFAAPHPGEVQRGADVVETGCPPSSRAGAGQARDVVLDLPDVDLAENGIPMILRQHLEGPMDVGAAVSASTRRRPPALCRRGRASKMLHICRLSPGTLDLRRFGFRADSAPHGGLIRPDRLECGSVGG